MVWHAETALPPGTDLAVVPGGFSYGDYLRCGAIAARAPVMDAVRAFAAKGGLVLGVCNGFQILCEAGLLPGVLMRNAALKFICRDVYLRVERSDTPFTQGYNAGQVIRVPVAHGEGNFIADTDTLARIEGEGGCCSATPRPTARSRRIQHQRCDQRDRRHRQRRRQCARDDAASGKPRRSRHRLHRRPWPFRRPRRAFEPRSVAREGLSGDMTGRSAADLRFIDVHHHVVLPEHQTALVRSGAADPSRPFRRNDPASVVCEKLAEIGVDAAVLNPLSVAGVHHGDDANARYLTRSVNEALASFVSAAPKKLGFFATLPFPDVDGALDELTHALDTLGADGIILLSNQNSVYIGDRRLDPLYAELDQRRAIVFIHPTIPPYVPDHLDLKLWPAYIEYAFDTTRVAANIHLSQVLRNYPNIRWFLPTPAARFRSCRRAYG